MKYAATVLIVIGACFSLHAEESIKNQPTGSPYKLSLLLDSTLLAAGGLLYFGGPEIVKKDHSLGEDAYSRDNMNILDRQATRWYSRNSSKASDYVRDSLFYLPSIFVLFSETRQDIPEIALLYIETYLLTSGTTGVLKDAVGRKRPYLYNSSLSKEERTQGDRNWKSFPSGHTTSAFAGAVFTSLVFSDYFPDSNWKIPVWSTCVAAASLVAYLRVRAGMHFPTDVIAGGAIGASGAVLIPYLHRKNGERTALLIGPGIGGENGICIGIREIH
jgi:membrane-associated phospholipid phosphatase